MALTKTTTLRLSTDLRDEIARLARERNSSMVDVVASAIEELRRQYWWNDVHSSLNDDTQVLDATASDGRGPH